MQNAKNTRHTPATVPPSGKDFIPCCVPYWDSQQFLKAGGRYSQARGYHILPTDYLGAFEEWLPRKWQFRGTPPVPVLLPDMLPTTSWEANLRTILSEAEWDRLRKFCYQAAGNTCIACGSRGEPHVEAHEAWRFDEKTGVQTLRGLLCLCPTCHKAKHLGFANRIGRLPQVLERLMWLNDWDEPTLAQELAKVEARQEELSQRTWTLDLAFLRTYGVR
jgi:hypothetical protein